MISIVAETINVQTILESIEDPSAGGVAMFIGTTRNSSGGKEVLSLEYEAYQPMALKLLGEIAASAAARWAVKKISIVHRVGRIGVGEASIVIGVSSAHRNEAFEACRFLIDTIKKSVPIWKKELYTDGDSWVGMEGSSGG